MNQFRATYNYLKHLAPSSLLQLFEASHTYFKPLPVIWSFSHLFRASGNYLELPAPISSYFQLFEAPYTYYEPISIIWSILHLFWASHSYLKLLATVLKPLTVISSFFAPILSHLHLFEASLTYFEPLGIIWISWSFQYGFRAMHLFWASCTFLRVHCSYLKLLASISSLLQIFEASSTYFELLAIILSFLHQV